MSSEPSDEDLMKNVFQLRERLRQTESSLQNINRLAELSDEQQPPRMSFSEPYVHTDSESVNLPPPLTLDDLGDLTEHNETDYSPIDESVLRQWNMNSDRRNRGQRERLSRSPSPKSRSKQKSSFSESTHSGFQRNLQKNFSPRRLAPSSSSPNMARHGKPSMRAFSCDDLTSAADLEHQLLASDSYRAMRKPSVTSGFAASAPISPRKRTSRGRKRDISPSSSEIYDRNFEPMEGISSDSSLSVLANFAMTTPKKSPLKDNCADVTLQGKENSTPRPISARSNATSVTMLGVEAESDKLRGRVSMLREDNERLHALVSDLRNQLEDERSRKSDNDGRALESLKEQIISLREESQANEKALQRAEEAFERSEMVCQEKIETILSLKDELSHVKSLLTESELAKQSVTAKCKEAQKDAQDLAQQLDASGEKLSLLKVEKEKAESLKQQVRALEKFKADISERAAKLQHTNSVLYSDLRNALLQMEAGENKTNERESEKIHISRALQDLQARFGGVRAELKRKGEELEVATEEKELLKNKLEMFTEKNHMQQDLLTSCQRDLEDARSQVTTLENEIRKTRADSARAPGVTYGERLLSPRDADDCNCEATSPRKQKAVIAELKMKLASKEAQIQRLEARVNSFSMEAEKLEGIRGELINVVERSRLGDKRAHELEGIVHQLEDERSKVTRQLMEKEDVLNDKKAECESLETRLQERTKSLTRIQNDFEEAEKKISRLESDIRSKSSDLTHMQQQLETKSLECESRYAALQRAEQEVAEKRRAIDNAAEWTGKREAESRRELEKIKKIHQEQHKDMEAQIDRLQSDCDRHREEARELQCVVCQLRDENDAIARRMKKAEADLDEARAVEDATRRKDQEALESLQLKAKESSEQVSSLENALSQCKGDIRRYVEQLEEASSKYQHQMALKNSEVAKFGSELKIAQESLRSEKLHAEALEANLTERQKMLEEASTRISELEDCQACLQGKVAKLEHHLTRELTKYTQEREHYEVKLQKACQELDAKNKQFLQLNEALKSVDQEFGSCRRELSTVEKQLEKLRNDADDRGKKLEATQAEANEAKTQLASRTEKLSALEERLKEADTERQDYRDKCLSYEAELTKNRAELQSLTQRSGQLQSALQNTDMDAMKKDTFIARLQSALKEAKENLAKKERQNEELERALEDRQWELQHRAAQLGQLEVNVREHKSNAEKRQIELQSEARKAHIELKERNSQVATLDDQLTSLREEVSEQRHQVEEKQQELRRVNREVEQREERIKDLEKALEESRTASEDRHRACLEVTQELRVAKEQSQRAAQQWQDAQRELTRLQRQQQTLFSDLEDMGKTDRAKDGQVSELVGKLNAAGVEKATLEKRYGDELDRLRGDVLKMHQQHQEEVALLRREHAQKVLKARTEAGGCTEELRRTIEREEKTREECEGMRDAVASLERELLARKQVIEAANDTIVMKEAEIVRLEAKLAGIERGKRMQEFGTSPEKTVPSRPSEQLDFLPSFLARDSDTNPERKTTWMSSHSKNGSPEPHGASTLFSGLDPDGGSLDPSFLHIAASTSRPGAADAALARALANSPEEKVLDRTVASDIDDSLFARVFVPNEIPDLPRPDAGNATPPENAARGSRVGVVSQSGSVPTGELRPEKCMADLQERLRASERRREEVTSKLRQLKANG